MSEVSKEYRRIRHALFTLCDIIESCQFKKIVTERYEPQLDALMLEFQEIKKKLAVEMADVSGQKEKWIKKVNSVAVDARLDESLSEDLKERIIEGIDELKQKIKSHKDS